MGSLSNRFNSSPQKLGSLVISWGAFLATFAVTTVLFHVCRPGPTTSYVNIYTEKCLAILNGQRPPDVLFIGTSRMFNGIDPRVVEDEFDRLGRSLSVWNLSLHNLSLAEQKQVLRDVFEHLKLQPRMIAYEPPLRLGMTLKNATTARSVYFMSVPCFADSWKFISAANRDALRIGYNLGSCGIFFAVGLTNYGLFSEFVFPERYLVNERSDGKIHYLMDSKGYWPPGMAADGVVTSTPKGALERATDSAATQEKEELTRSDCLPANQIELIREIDDLIKNKGTRSLAVLMPKYWTSDAYYRRCDFQLSRSMNSIKEIDLLDYQSRADHPSLYQAGLWHDFNHFSEPGADLFSRMIAREVLHRLEGSN